jgi:hypothetical protein
MRLPRNEFCPVHRSRSCCGREHILTKTKLIRMGVQRVEDPHHHRELRSPAEMHKLMNHKIVDQGGKCALCHKDFTTTATFCQTTRI